MLKNIYKLFQFNLHSHTTKKSSQYMCLSKSKLKNAYCPSLNNYIELYYL